MEYNYYKEQLKLLNLSSEYPLSIMVWDGNGNKTKQLDLNSESIKVFIEFLTELDKK